MGQSNNLTALGPPHVRRQGLSMEQRRWLFCYLGLVPVIALSLAVLLWADYQHEFSSLMDAHASHSVAVGSTEERPRPPDAAVPPAEPGPP